MTRLRWLAASLLGWVPVACSSSTRTPDAGAFTDGPAAGVAVGGRAGQGGGAGGAGGVGGGTSAAAGSGGAGGTLGSGGTGGTSLNPTDVCRAAVAAQAERLFTCMGQDTIEGYLRVANACPDYVFNTDSNRTVEAVAACLPVLRARTCTDVAAAVMPSCYPCGKRDADARCAFSSQCASGVCNGGGVSCGVCSAGGRSAGSVCQFWYQCAGGSHCTGSGRCADNGTPTYAPEGQPCDVDATPIAGCVGDLYCKRASVAGPGTCTAAPGAGQPCAANGMTNGMLSTTICAAGTTCVQGTCQPPGGCGSGLSCDSASYCASTGSGVACAPRAALGQACSAGPSGQPCVAPAACLDDGKCQVPRAEGQACDADNPCDRYLDCVAGACQNMTAGDCPV